MILVAQIQILGGWLSPHLLGPEPLAAIWLGPAGPRPAKGAMYDLLQKNSIGAKEETGFTEESNKNYRLPAALPGPSWGQ